MTFKKLSKKTSSISTSSLPDIVFILLFFFMVATRMRESEIKVKQSLPNTTKIERLVKKDQLAYIYIGAPLAQDDDLSHSPVLQLDDQIASVDEVTDFIRNKIAPNTALALSQLIVAINCDKIADIGLLIEVKTELRKAGALKISYINIPKN
ncbi:MAG: biopolymer transport protein ExbD [Limisphaerales bacterium]|jgi:biopolymer transport protein ExbD